MIEEDKVLGKSQGDYSQYKNIAQPTPEVLVGVPRAVERKKFTEYDPETIPMVGFDTWHGYEISALTENGMPVNFVAKIMYNSDTPNIIESKSMKLYWNSYNMHRVSGPVYNVKSAIRARAEKDLSIVAGGKVWVSLFDTQYNLLILDSFDNYVNLDDILSIDNLLIQDYIDNPDVLENHFHYENKEMRVYTDKLRSNCKITHQPDFGDLFIRFVPNETISPNWSSVLKYIISFRQESHFHEEIVERIYHALYTKYKPDHMLVAARYTRRGGWDINPVRATDISMFEKMTEMDMNYCDIKTGRQ